MADWSVFRRAWSAFVSEWRGWIIAAFLACLALGVLGLFARVPYLLAGLKLRELPWYLKFVDMTIIGAIGSACFYWFYVSAIATIDPSQSDRNPLREAVSRIPLILIARALIAVPLLALTFLFDDVTAWLISWSVGFVFVLFEPLMAQKGVTPLRAVFAAPILLFRSPSHTVVILLAYLLGIAGILVFVVGAFVTLPFSLLVILFALRDLTSVLTPRSNAE